MKRTFCFLMMIGWLAWLPTSAQTKIQLNDGEAHGDPPFLLEDGWTPLLNGTDLSGWHAQEGRPSAWFTTRGVRWERLLGPGRLRGIPEPGDRILNGPEGRTANLVTDEKFGDAELYLEFMISKGSNSGVYLHGLYEIQVFDSWGSTEPMTSSDSVQECEPAPWRVAVLSDLVSRPPVRFQREEDRECPLHPRSPQRAFHTGRRGTGRPDARSHEHSGGAGQPGDAAGRSRSRGVPQYPYSAATAHHSPLRKHGKVAAPPARRPGRTRHYREAGGGFCDEFSGSAACCCRAGSRITLARTIESSLGNRSSR
jgi:hypothetical protein